MNKGHIQLCSLSKYKDFKDNYTKKLFIVRNPMKVNCELYGMVHVPELAPSPELYKKYITRWKYNEFTQEEENRLKDFGPGATWWSLYYEQFIAQMHEDYMQVNLARIIELLNQGVDILLVCFCGNLEHCHRKILGDYYASLGYEVRYK